MNKKWRESFNHDLPTTDTKEQIKFEKIKYNSGNSFSKCGYCTVIDLDCDCLTWPYQKKDKNVGHKNMRRVYAPDMIISLYTCPPPIWLPAAVNVGSDSVAEHLYHVSTTGRLFHPILYHRQWHSFHCSRWQSEQTRKSPRSMTMGGGGCHLRYQHPLPGGAGFQHYISIIWETAERSVNRRPKMTWCDNLKCASDCHTRQIVRFRPLKISKGLNYNYQNDVMISDTKTCWRCIDIPRRATSNFLATVLHCTWNWTHKCLVKLGLLNTLISLEATRQNICSLTQCDPHWST